MKTIKKVKAIELLCKELQDSDGALSAVSLVKCYSDVFNKTTIYRSLERLENKGIIHSFLDKSGVRWYATCKKFLRNDIHPHFQCLDCGKVDCLSLDIKIPHMPSREVISSQILIQGRCENCCTK